MSGGRPLTLIPYVIGGWLNQDDSRPPRGSPWTALAGGEARMRIGEDSWAELTVLTDFAQVDLDDPGVQPRPLSALLCRAAARSFSTVSMCSRLVLPSKPSRFSRVASGWTRTAILFRLLGGLKTLRACSHWRIAARLATDCSMSLSGGGSLWELSPLTNDADRSASVQPWVRGRTSASLVDRANPARTSEAT